MTLILIVCQMWFLRCWPLLSVVVVVVTTWFQLKLHTLDDLRDHYPVGTLETTCVDPLLASLSNATDFFSYVSLYVGRSWRLIVPLG